MKAEKKTYEEMQVLIPLIQEDMKTMTAGEACAKNGTTYAQYYYWALDTVKNKRVSLVSNRQRKPRVNSKNEPALIPLNEQTGINYSPSRKVFVLYGTPTEVAETIRSLQ